MEGEKYNLAKAQEEADKLKQKVESGEVSNYGDAEKLVEQESSSSNPEERPKHDQKSVDKVTQLRNLHDQLSKGDYRNVIASIGKWPQEQQLPIIEAMLENRWDDVYIYGKFLFALMRNWPVDKAMPYVIKALQYQKKGYISEDRRTCVAEAMSNWPEDQIEDVLSKEENLTWTEDYPSAFASAEENKEEKVNQIYLNILRNRTEPITEGMKLRLKEGLGWKHQQGRSVVNVLKNHPELFDELASDLFLSPGDIEDTAADYAVETLQLLPRDKQYEFIEAIADGFSRSWSHRSSSGLDRLKTLVSAFDDEHRTKLISNLLQREESVWMGNTIRNDWDNAFDLLKKEHIITDPIIIKAILKLSLGSTDSLLVSRANQEVNKIEQNSQTEPVVRDAVFEWMASELTNPKYNTFEKITGTITKFNLGEPPIEVKNSVIPLMEQEIMSGKLDHIKQLQNIFHLGTVFFVNADNLSANKIEPDEIIKFIKYFGDAELETLLPNTLSKVREMIFSKLATDQDLADYFVENLDKYYQQPWVSENVAKAVKHYSVARKFIYAVKNNSVYANEPWVGTILEDANAIVQQHKDDFEDEDQQDEYGYGHGAEGFREHDSYENHPWLFTGQQIKISSALSELLSGKLDEARLQELGINNSEIAPLLVEVNEKINTTYQNFLEQIQSNPNIKKDDKQALLNPESSSVRMTPLLDNIRAFVARYFVQSVKGDVTRLSEIGNLTNNLDRIIAEGFRRYIKVNEVDVPLYDKLYEEFDNLRETGRYPLEVFLGRDGIYAWIGRRAQDVARRRKMGLEGRKKLKEMGEVIEIHPQYTVYPRYFRDNLNYETKRQFLEQEGISLDADPLFYDTGYTGTIPEQIMKIMDFEDEDIEKRIRLLSAPSVHRRVKGISENARSEIIEYIEHNAKLEETAEGLIVDEKTGKIRHIARPTNPEEQFYFMMVKQAVERHYWLQEKLHHEPSGNVNLDSEHYTIRIRQDYAKLLPQEFLHDPKAFFVGHGELMKGSKGEGEYPDEEVTLFKLTDSTEIVAKRIELRKAKEARKEFAILIAAKKAGLPTAEPVGFLSGKEDADGSYLLMKKLEGRSGRKFEKELRETSKYSDEQIKDIMKQVAEKNREMAELFRTTLKIDKRWRIKDTLIEFNEETGEVESVVPIDWERAQNYNPNTPKEIDEIA